MVTPLPISKIAGIAGRRKVGIGTPASIKPNLRRSGDAVWAIDAPLKLLQFLKLHRVCSTSLKQLQSESRKTLNLLALLTQYPTSTEGRNELQLQYEREERARSDYQDHQRELIALIKRRETEF